MNTSTSTQRAFKTSYIYENPGPAGPYKGWVVTPCKHQRGDTIRAPFGTATVRSSKEIKT